MIAFIAVICVGLFVAGLTISRITEESKSGKLLEARVEDRARELSKLRSSLDSFLTFPKKDSNGIS